MVTVVVMFIMTLQNVSIWSHDRKWHVSCSLDYFISNRFKDPIGPPAYALFLAKSIYIGVQDCNPGCFLWLQT